MGMTAELVKKLDNGQSARKPEPQRMALGTQQETNKRGGCCWFIPVSSYYQFLHFCDILL